MDGEYASRIIELAQSEFVPNIKRISDELWNNSIFACVRRPYYMCNFEDAVAEYYIPTALSAENVMQYHRVVIAIYSELDKNIVDEEVKRLKVPFTYPMGRIDSETIFLIAPKVSKNQIENLKKNGRKAIMRGFRHEPKRGYMTVIIINSIPEIAWKKVTELLAKFWADRLSRLLNKLGVEISPRHIINKIMNCFSITRNLVNFIKYLMKHKVIEKLSLTLRTIIKSMCKVVEFLLGAMKRAMDEIGFQNVLLSAIRAINQLKSIEERIRLMEALSKKLFINVRIKT